jgi:ABC-type amino acid transport substrate-binding protein
MVRSNGRNYAELKFILMEDSKMKKLLSTITLLLAFLFLLTACQSKAPASAGGAGSPTPPASGSETTSEEPAVEAQKILIGNSGGPNPYSYLDEATEEYVGYDRDVIAEIDALLPQYTFEFEVSDFPSIFTGIDAGRYQMGVNNITKKPEREERWLFGQEPYSFNGQALLVAKDNTDINSIYDLGGKKVYTSNTGLFSDIFIDTYNKEHPDDPIITLPTGADDTKNIEDLISGVVDFSFTEYWGVKIRQQNYPEQFTQLRVVPLPDEEAKQIEDPLAWYIFPRTEDGQALADAVDGAIRDLKASGKLREIGGKWFGEADLPEWFNG